MAHLRYRVRVDTQSHIEVKRWKQPPSPAAPRSGQGQMRYQEHRLDDRARNARTFTENIEDLVANIRPGQPVPTLTNIEGTDASGTVHCVVDLTGDLVKLRIDPGWWNAPGPAHIAAAILDAVRYARSKATMARLILDRYGHPLNARPADHVPHFATEPSPPLPPPDAPEFERALAATASRTAAILDEVERFSRERDEARRRIVTGPHGLFRVILVGLEIQSAEVNERGIRPSDADRLATDARAALLAAAQLAIPGYRPPREAR